MGSFSWNKADNLTAIENVARNSSFKFLIPKEFGGGFIKDNYQDYGYLGTLKNGEPKHDMYELLAFWNNADNLKYDGDYPLMKEIDQYTDHNRCIGIDMGCYDEQILRLKYPLKLVSASFKGTYEDLKTCSLSDPDQGFFSRKRKKPLVQTVRVEFRPIDTDQVFTGTVLEEALHFYLVIPDGNTDETARWNKNRCIVLK